MHSLKTFYRPDDYPYWQPWREFIHKFTQIGKPQLLSGGTPTARPGFSPRVPLGKPPDACEEVTGRNLRRGFSFQVKFKGSGHVVIKHFRIHAQKQIEKSTSLNRGTLQQ